MTAPEPIAVFAYAFAHRKGQDFLLELATAGYRDVTVIGAPWKQLAHRDPTVYYPTQLLPAQPLPVRPLCDALGFHFHECEHDDVETISALQCEARFKLAIIAGARIIKRAVIDLFPEGILNIHPGKLPETAGLDLFYHTLAKGVPMGVTAHFIDARVDAGHELFFEETPIGPDDTVEAVQHNNYQSQLRALRRFVALRERGPLTTVPVDRPHKNKSMEPDEKRAVLERFTAWRSAQYLQQQTRALFAACEVGDAEAIEQALAIHPHLLSARTAKGWTPLIVAAFNQNIDAVRILLERGADPNDCGRNGTTVLMYAKTALLDTIDPDFALLDILLDAGAEPLRQDAVGRDIFYYLDAAGDTSISRHLNCCRGQS